MIRIEVVKSLILFSSGNLQRLSKTNPIQSEIATFSTMANFINVAFVLGGTNISTNVCFTEDELASTNE